MYIPCLPRKPGLAFDDMPPEPEEIVPSASRLQRNPDLIATEMDGEVIMLHMRSGRYLTLNAVGSHIWHALERPQTRDALVTSVLNTFDTPDRASVERDVEVFFAEMLQNDMVYSIDT